MINIAKSIFMPVTWESSVCSQSHSKQVPMPTEHEHERSRDAKDQAEEAPHLREAAGLAIQRSWVEQL